VDRHSGSVAAAARQLGRAAPGVQTAGMANTPPYVADPGRHCVYCQHVVVRALISPVRGYTRSLGCEKNPGHAGEEHYSVCCDFRREPGSDDEDITQ